jgi:hypothetical protein
MEKFIVKSFYQRFILADETYLNTIDECKKWCEGEKVIFEQDGHKEIHFEIHHVYGAKTYLKGIVTDQLTKWIEKEYDSMNIPLVAPWWKISNLPTELNPSPQFRFGFP